MNEIKSFFLIIQTMKAKAQNEQRIMIIMAMTHRILTIALLTPRFSQTMSVGSVAYLMFISEPSKWKVLENIAYL